MALDNFIPTIWSARLLYNLEPRLVYTQPGIINRNYEGEIRYEGDSVRINSLGPVTVTPYAKNVPLGVPQIMNDASQTLQITQADSFRILLDDVDYRQQKPKLMDDIMRASAIAMAQSVDQWMAGQMWQGVPAGNTQGAVGGGLVVGFGAGETNPYIALLNAGVALDEANVDREGRWAIVPPWFDAYLRMDSRFVGSGAPAADTRAVNGFIGKAAGFNLYVTNNVPFAAGPVEYKIVLGTDYATTYADQIDQVEAYRSQAYHGDEVRGLHLYGARVVYPNALALIIANTGTPA